jgi:hypothetical protein
MRRHSFIDPTNGKFDLKLTRCYHIASQIILRHGAPNDAYDQGEIDELWDYPEPSPSAYFLRENIRMPVVKSFIHTYMESDDPIWNADFLHGVARNGKIVWSNYHFPTLLLYNNGNTIKELIRSCPFGGKLGKTNRWSLVPALYLKFSEHTIPFMAGVLAGATLEKKNGKDIAFFNRNTLGTLEKFGIPIEDRTRYGNVVISPFWVALLSPWMPEVVCNKLKDVSKPIKSDIYAPVLWKTYFGSNFKRNGIPYLKSRRQIFYKYKSKELVRLRVEHGLTELDNRIKEVVKIWSKQ